MRRPGSKAGLLFRLVIPAVVVFIGTILTMIAAVMGNQDSPLAGWLDRNVGTLLIVEFAVIIVLTVLAMTVDRIQTLKLDPSPGMTDSSRPGNDSNGNIPLPSGHDHS